LTYIPIPVTQYVAYQKLTFPPVAPPGYQNVSVLITCIISIETYRRYPGGRKKEHLNQDIEDNSYIPGLEFWSFGVDTLALTTNDIETNTNSECKDCIRI
jgi:hypothetical protein